MANFISEFELSVALDVSTKSVKSRAKKEMWPHKKATTKGGYKRLYFFDLLPNDVKVKLAELWVKDRTEP